ncbi:phage holin family protein, partial [Salmonella enterica]|uniref:phage holin family protein n=1 Tax=Salmonella enterica TaxID=28901 RepID=UPI0039C5EF41
MHFDPQSWDSWIELYQSWRRGDVPIGGVVMEIVDAILRLVYHCSSRKETKIDVLLC